jgi:hypothetical protein
VRLLTSEVARTLVFVAYQCAWRSSQFWIVWRLHIGHRQCTGPCDKLNLFLKAAHHRLQ